MRLLLIFTRYDAAPFYYTIAATAIFLFPHAGILVCAEYGVAGKYDKGNTDFYITASFFVSIQQWLQQLYGQG